jgi:transcription antitermination factor NusG
MTDSPVPQRWYALYVRSRNEKSVCAQLDAKRYDVFLPLYRARHQWADRLKTVSLPLFPGYVFCRFDPSTRSGVLATSGVIDVVRVGLEPEPVETSEIDAIRLVVESPLFSEPYPGLVKGQRVTMSGGPLRGLTGSLLEIRNSVRLALSVDLLGRSVIVEIERDWAALYQPATLATWHQDSASPSGLR